MPSAADPVVDEIASRRSDLGRPLRFDEYVEIALYGSHGFYQSTGRAGRRGDFLTSPEVGPLFGEVLARWMSAELDALGSAEPAVVIEAGAGPGSLARSVLQAAPHLADRYIAVERAAAQRASHPAGIMSSAALPTGPLRGIVVANELLDNLPFRLAVHDGTWREAYVDLDRSGVLTEVLLPSPPEWSWLPAGAPHGARLPVQEQAAAWILDVRSRLTSGVVLVADYCAATTAELMERPWRTWLRTYRGHERGAHYLRDAGKQDITVD
ncbi:MAG: SAM-dependent methyltransferase, partial [Ilumatobacteraceae bacterium]